ncbi:MAG: hypothetical protein KDA60_13665 [Planctomycetales bacterium]|nr:hypothetical protein [Planctomycetales bacterium]
MNPPFKSLLLLLGLIPASFWSMSLAQATGPAPPDAHRAGESPTTISALSSGHRTSAPAATTALARSIYRVAHRQARNHAIVRASQHRVSDAANGWIHLWHEDLAAATDLAVEPTLASRPPLTLDELMINVRSQWYSWTPSVRGRLEESWAQASPAKLLWRPLSFAARSLAVAYPVVPRTYYTLEDDLADLDRGPTPTPAATPTPAVMPTPAFDSAQQTFLLTAADWLGGAARCLDAAADRLARLAFSVEPEVNWNAPELAIPEVSAANID